MGGVLGILSVSFVAASLLAFLYTSAPVRGFYKISAVWMGLLSFLALAAILAWATYGVGVVTGMSLNFHRLVQVSFGAALVLGFYDLFNAHWTRVTRIRVTLQNLPDTWRGQSGVDQRRASGACPQWEFPVAFGREEPDAIFIAGDLFDGTAIDAVRAAGELSAPHGVYFVAGNHEQFGDDSKYLNAIASSGVRVLRNETVNLGGLRVVGVPYRSAAQGNLASVLRRLPLDRNRASILATHAPDNPEAAEAAGFSLQLSGHAHLGQFFPWSWMARRIYRQFVYGLSRIGKMQVFTSSGVGTWGPPLRLGSKPEIVLLESI